MLDVNARQSMAMELMPVVEAAGRRILALRGARARTKDDGSPVTAADDESEGILLDALARRFGPIPVVSEESHEAQGLAPGQRSFFLIDPLDGTHEFVDGRDEFTVNVALIEDGCPTVGLLCAPALGRLVASYGAGRLVHRRNGEDVAAASRPPGGPPVVVVSRSHLTPATTARLNALGRHDQRRLGSSLKFMLIASGEADLYPRLGRTMLWDVAAGQAVVEAAGGVVLGIDGKPLRYDPRARLDIPAFVAAASPARALEALHVIATPP